MGVVKNNKNTDGDSKDIEKESSTDFVYVDENERGNVPSQAALEEIGVDDIEFIEDRSASEPAFDVSIVEKQEDTRGRLAQFYLIGFFICLFSIGVLSLLTAPAEGRSAIDNLKDSTLSISAILSGPLGFIIGYYFRKGEE